MLFEHPSLPPSPIMEQRSFFYAVKMRTWPVLAIGFGSVVFLMLLFGLDSWRRAGQIYVTMLAMHQSHARAEQSLHEIESGIYLSGIFVRDFLLDYSHLTSGFQRQQLLALHASMENQMSALTDSTISADRKVLARLQRETAGYWDLLEPVFDWTPQQKAAMGTAFLRRKVLPRRTAVLEIAGEARALNAADLADRQKEMDLRMAEFRRSGQRSLAVVVTLAVLAALASILRVSRLENRTRRQHVDTERAEQEMRRLSRKLVHAQEDERRSLSRELHDEIGQTLTALGVELGNLQRLRSGPEQEFLAHLDDARQLTTQTLRTVRGIAAGLRPSVLDDLGLGPALGWLAREFSRRTGIPVEVALEGPRTDLPEEHRTCVYRVVQEALTNCARHAAAHNIRVALHSEPARLSLIVQDDGQGLPAAPRDQPGAAPHMGLVGMEDRVREIGGTFSLESQPGRGTLVKVSIPIPQEAAV